MFYMQHFPVNMWLTFKLNFLIGICFLFSSCGKYPDTISVANDIENLSPKTEMIILCGLPRANYPKLAKFIRLRHLRFDCPDTVKLDDLDLIELGKIQFDTLRDVSLRNCSGITDLGLKGILRIKSISQLQLQNTSVSDVGIEELLKHSSLEGINVAGCEKVTFLGLGKISGASTLNEVGFSTENLVQSQVLTLLSRVSRGSHYEVFDDLGKLDSVASCYELAKNRGFKLLIRKKGTVQRLR
jgi:hypothetical protein